MQFSSIKEYFYKLYNYCYALTLIPLCIFIYLYLEMQVGKNNSLIQAYDQVLIFQVLFFFLAVSILTIVHWQVKKKLKTLTREYSLGTKMDKYFYLAITRIGIGNLVSCLAGLGLYLSGSEIFSLFLLFIFFWMAYHWPSPRKLCTELSLKGDEKEMVLYKRESF